jgi:arylsulfatase B
MTGKYSTKLGLLLALVLIARDLTHDGVSLSLAGMQHYVIPSDEPWGLPLGERTIAEYFKDAGYRTAIVGKWHLGFFEKSYTPLMRGFDTHVGYLGPYIGYYDHSLIMLDRNYSRGADMRRNYESMNADGKYATDLFTDEAVNLIKSHDASDPLLLLVSHLAPHAGNEDKPLEAPEDVISKFAYIKDEKRRTLAAMIDVMDDGIGRIVAAISEKGIMDNTIIMFLSGGFLYCCPLILGK